jgi:hypothetical protein
MASTVITNISNTINIEDVQSTKTLSNIKPFEQTLSNIAFGTIIAATTIVNPSTIVDLKPTISNLQTVNYSKVVTATSIMPFRLSLTNIGIEGYDPANPPGIGIQIIGFSNYIL